MYKRLNEAQILRTLDLLIRRIEERFPGSGLGRVSRELRALGDVAAADSMRIRRPMWPVRIAGVVFVLVVLAVLSAAFAALPRFTVGEWTDLVQGTEALVQDMVFLGIATWFVLTLESRFKRKRALAAIHGLRSIAHVVDMHQLTKDPERTLAARSDTASSPVRDLTHEQLGRYLDYCSELLSVTSKLAALYVQDLRDPVVLEAVSDLENLCGGLSGKIWQKITLLDRHLAGGA